MKHLPNILSSLRIVGAVALLLSDVSSILFGALYIVCGISDIADGWLARKLKCVTRTGALLDSVADICFVACCAWKLLPILELPQWLWLWAGVIVAIKVVNQLSALVMYGRCCFPHTLANKWAGFLLFITVPMTLWSIAPHLNSCNRSHICCYTRGTFHKTERSPSNGEMASAGRAMKLYYMI